MYFENSLYDKIVAIIEDYLGPAAPRFLTRIATNHLGKPATHLTHKDLPELITWVQLAANVMTEDRSATEQLIHDLQHLQSSTGTTRRQSVKATRAVTASRTPKR